MSLSYKKSGVNIRLGDKASQILYGAASQTWVNRAGRLGEVVTPFDDFTGLRVINIGGLPADTGAEKGERHHAESLGSFLPWHHSTAI